MKNTMKKLIAAMLVIILAISLISGALMEEAGASDNAVVADAAAPVETPAVEAPAEESPVAEAAAQNAPAEKVIAEEIPEDNTAAQPEEIVVDVNVYAKPTFESDIIIVLKSNDRIVVMKDLGHWYQISYMNGQSVGYMFDETLAKLTNYEYALPQDLDAEEPEADEDIAEEPAAEPDVEIPAAETPAAEIPAEETPAAETPAAEIPAEETPAAETPAAETPAEEIPAEEIPAAETPAAETPAEEIPAEEPVVEEPAQKQAEDNDVTVTVPKEEKNVVIKDDKVPLSSGTAVDVITEADLPENAQKIATLADQLDPNRSIDIYLAFDGTDLYLGDEVTLMAVLHGYDNAVYTLQWQSSPDDTNWSDISDANNSSYSFSLTMDNYKNYWRVAVVVDDVLNESNAQ